jgi:hypothetical protein
MPGQTGTPIGDAGSVETSTSSITCNKSGSGGPKWRSMTSRASLTDQAVTPTPKTNGVLGRVPANCNQKRLTLVRVARGYVADSNRHSLLGGYCRRDPSLTPVACSRMLV